MYWSETTIAVNIAVKGHWPKMGKFNVDKKENTPNQIIHTLKRE